MALPTKDNPLLLPYHDAWNRQVNEWMSWYSGNTNSILNFYDQTGGGYWVNGEGEITFSERKKNDWVHMPLAADIAGVSASLLFSEAPKIQIPKGPARDRWNDFYRENNLPSRLLEAAELAAAGGGVYLKLVVDTSISSVPILDVVPASDVRPRFRSGRLVSFMQTSIVRIEDNGSVVYRLVESRDLADNGAAVVEFGVYKGDRTSLGRDIDPAELPETSHLAERSTTTTAEGSGIGVVYIPNVLPNRINPSIREGVSDLHGVISLLDALDDAYTAWMKDIELGRGRAFVDKEILKDTKMDVNQDYFLKVSMDESKFGGASGYKPFEVFQFELRTEEHKATCLHLIEQIVDRAGYSPASFGFSVEGRAESGTALRIRERKSMLTRAKKGNYWSDALRKFLQSFWAFDLGTGLSSPYDIPDPTDVSIDIQDSIIPEALELSQTANSLRAAEAASTRTLVRMMHPDWPDELVDEEVALIKSEGSTALPQEFELP